MAYSDAVWTMPPT